MKLRILSFADHRSPEQLARYAAIEQARADVRIELEWARRVRCNILRRQFGDVALLKRQAT